MRFVYPIVDNQSNHLGSVEISFDIKLFIKKFIEQLGGTTHFYLKKSIIDSKVWQDMRKEYYNDSPIDGYYVEKNIYEYVNKNSLLQDVEKIPNKNTINEILVHINEDKSHFTLYSRELNKILVFIAIHNPLTKENVAYLCIGQSGDEISKEINHFYTIFIIMSLLSITIIYIFYARLYKHNSLKKTLEETVKEKTKELEKEKKTALNALKTKSDFLANMSHEIRTPLNAIIGFIDIIKENEKDEQNKNYLNIIKSSSDSLLNIINDILDFSKIESGNITIEHIEFNLKKLIKDIKLLFFEKAHEKNIEIKINIDKEIPDIIISDPLRLKQILSNLISNAIKFTKENGEIKLDAKYEKSSNTLTFEVIDNGIGIAKENIDKVFKPFSQEDSSTTRKYGGTGLGLSISSDLVKLMQGELKVSSEFKNGSKFYFSIPIKVSHNIKVSKEKDIKIREDIDFESKKILIVEDDKANQMFLKIMFKKMNLNFDVANDGLEAIDMFKNSKYDLILMDENMPNMNGIEATKHILIYENEKNLKHTPIIAFTANALKGDREKFIDAGMDEYMTKPFKKDKFIELINKTL